MHLSHYIMCRVTQSFFWSFGRTSPWKMMRPNVMRYIEIIGPRNICINSLILFTEEVFLSLLSLFIGSLYWMPMIFLFGESPQQFYQLAYNKLFSKVKKQTKKKHSLKPKEMMNLSPDTFPSTWFHYSSSLYHEICQVDAGECDTEYSAVGWRSRVLRWHCFVTLYFLVPHWKQPKCLVLQWSKLKFFDCKTL